MAAKNGDWVILISIRQHGTKQPMVYVQSFGNGDTGKEMAHDALSNYEFFPDRRRRLLVNTTIRYSDEAEWNLIEWKFNMVQWDNDIHKFVGQINRYEPS